MIELENLYDLTQKDPDRTLYLAIILQALLDLTKPKDKEDTTSEIIHEIRRKLHSFL